MPLVKLTDTNKAKILEVKRRCPCITNTTLAYIFDISPSRITDILKESGKYSLYHGQYVYTGRSK